MTHKCTQVCICAHSSVYLQYLHCTSRPACVCNTYKHEFIYYVLYKMHTVQEESILRPNSWTKSRQKSYEFFSLLFTVTSTALPWDFYFFKLTEPLTASVKEKGGKPDQKNYTHFPMVEEFHAEISSLRTFKIMPRNLSEIVHSWIRLLVSLSPVRNSVASLASRAVRRRCRWRP